MSLSGWILAAALSLLAAVGPVLAAPAIQVEGLMTNAAILQVDGERKMLRVGDTFKGVTLVAAYSRTATLEVGGETIVLGLSSRIGSTYEPAPAQVVTIQRDAMLQYHTIATINGRQLGALVDTGANVVAMSSAHATTLGLDYRAGTPAIVETASGQISAWIITLPSVSVGGIRVANVQASVVEGNFPATVLLGMTFLRHVKIQEDSGVLSLSRDW